MADKPATKFLIGWKQIASWIGDVSWETVRKWHRRYNLPIKRVGKTIIILAADIDEWIVKKK